MVIQDIQNIVQVILEEHNRQLESQLHKLKGILEVWKTYQQYLGHLNHLLFTAWRGPGEQDGNVEHEVGDRVDVGDRLAHPAAQGQRQLHSAGEAEIKGGNRLQSQLPSECDYLQRTRVYGDY